MLRNARASVNPRLITQATLDRPGVVLIAGQPYTLAIHHYRDQITGYRLHAPGPNGNTYDLPADLTQCECLGWLRWGYYGTHLCKHLATLLSLRQKGLLPPLT